MIVLGNPSYYRRFGFSREAVGRMSCRFAGPNLMGLALTKTLVELHEGTFEISSRVGRGTEITVRFPPQRILADTSVGIALSRADGSIWETPVRLP